MELEALREDNADMLEKVLVVLRRGRCLVPPYLCAGVESWWEGGERRGRGVVQS